MLSIQHHKNFSHKSTPQTFLLELSFSDRATVLVESFYTVQWPTDNCRAPILHKCFQNRSPSYQWRQCLIKSDSVCFYQADNSRIPHTTHLKPKYLSIVAAAVWLHPMLPPPACCRLSVFLLLPASSPHPPAAACLYLERSWQVMKQAPGRKNNAFDGWASSESCSRKVVHCGQIRGPAAAVVRQAGWGPSKLPDSSRLARWARPPRALAKNYLVVTTPLASRNPRHQCHHEV